MGKKYETIFEGTKMSIFSSMILKIVLILLRKRRKKKKGNKLFFPISKSSISNVNANLINRRESVTITTWTYANDRDTRT